MKTIQLAVITLLSLLAFSSCLKDQCSEQRTFIEFRPVYRSQAQLDAPVSTTGPRALQNPGIIYSYKQYLLINEYREGIHVLNNSDPKNPQFEAFISIEGNEHFAISDDVLQANKFNALLTLDISDINNIQEKSRVSNVFNQIWEDPNRGFLVYYEERPQRVVLDCTDPNFNSERWSGDDGGLFFAAERVDFATANADQAGAAGGGNVGIGGSMARFTITHDHLYAVSQSDLKVFDLEEPCRPRLVNSRSLGWGIETIYPFKDRLFIGSETGMSIYSVETPGDPIYLSEFQHARACDPVIADDETAYVTLRDGNACAGFNNQMDVVDVSDVLSPYLVRTYGMINPHGLTKIDDVLIVCEGNHGIKILDAQDRESIREILHLDGFHAHDAIALSHDLVLIIGKNGLIQMDLSDPGRPDIISEIAVQNEN